MQAGPAVMACAIVMAGTAGSALGADKRGYTRFNPTPDHLLRDLTTDRPDTTEAPFTVDAGHVQIECTLVGFTRSARDSDGTFTDSIELGTTNVRIGLTGWADAGFIWRPLASYARTTNRAAASSRRASAGWSCGPRSTCGATSRRPGTRPAGVRCAPHRPRQRVSPEFAEGGLIVPDAIKLTDKLGLGLSAGVSWVEGEAGRDHAEYLASASLGVDWSEKLGSYYEVAGRFNTDEPGGGILVLGTAASPTS
jgi:hypothetical protein